MTIYKLTIVLFLITFYSNAQTLERIFIELNFNNLSKDQKNQMIENFRSGKTGIKHGVGYAKEYLSAYEPKNGYLIISAASEGTTTLTYWNLTNGNKLIGVEKAYCGGACSSYLFFYNLVDTLYSELKLHDIIPEISLANFFDVDQMKKDGLDELNWQEEFPETYPLLYSLPSQGKNIIVESQTHELGYIPEKYQKYNRGNKLELIWNGGTFLIGEVSY